MLFDLVLIHVLLSFSDLNECAQYGSCHQLCRNEKGSFKCSCANGYVLQNNHRSCKAGGTLFFFSYKSLLVPPNSPGDITVVHEQLMLLARGCHD